MDGAGVSGLTWLLPPEGKVWCRVFVTLGWEWCLVSRDAPCLRDAHVGCPPQTLCCPQQLAEGVPGGGARHLPAGTPHCGDFLLLSLVWQVENSLACGLCL